jgi:hypothetical protein
MHGRHATPRLAVSCGRNQAIIGLPRPGPRRHYGRSEEVTPRLPLLSLLDIHQPQVRVVNQSCRLESVPRLLVRQLWQSPWVAANRKTLFQPRGRLIWWVAK